MTRGLTRNYWHAVTSTVGYSHILTAQYLQPPSVVGRASAVIAALTLLAMIAQLNLTNVFVRLLPAAGRLGYGRAARILDMRYRDGIIGPPDGSKPREVLKRPDWLKEVDPVR